MGRLTTHVLDTARGTPGSNLRIEIFRLEGDTRTRLGEVHTNDDGRCDAPLLEGEAFTAGEYELLFHAGEYLDACRAPGASPRFLDRIPLRFGVADAEAHYHVPLLLSPYGYSTYRGS
ncbi:hydroxyisourate hydrolase [Modicisalibacter tunisiensis]|uniref:5-hydroxyisourate hydrolase n=1 Tax=Modicisalibacter tunisiensis TaxID=390637 RepID=A0ABS7WX68_9GAMM|nr:hydroxyisourate hydrolase [Modicisalibacter tunisiensis]MBZ9539783.1 hydroxyisourate hydrolase [Modicisalibacter tunisiensis]MBZ9566828.1 hydroxyisourate hydrolase [Modicisalibacter tunisiensis]